jgi:hypothetical protein
VCEVDDFVFRLVLWIDIFFVNLQVVLMKSIVSDRKAMVDGRYLVYDNLYINLKIKELC